MNPHRHLVGDRTHVVGPDAADLVDVYDTTPAGENPLVLPGLTVDERIELIAMLLATVPHGPDLPHAIANRQASLIDAYETATASTDAEEARQLAQWRAEADQERLGLDPSRAGQ